MTISKTLALWNQKNSDRKIWISFVSGEFRVRWLANKDADYFTNDLDDAIATAEASFN